MANNRYKDFLSEMERKLNALRQFAMDRIFGGVEVPQLEVAHAECVNIRAEIQRAEGALIALRNRRDEFDKSYDGLMRRAVAGLIADPNFGPDCDAYDAMGYKRRSERKRPTLKARPEEGG